ncbi:efflux RND transporter permease subunit [Sulfurimonas sp. MAG313]|nr:efflux RND transporter permease subunit [Sulfurimonas sp. MAG313]MDF1882086.1 efflux RND transporter permease subunit [Sulfurimonas sp. MAG313]
MIKFSLLKPVVVTVGVLLIVMFGLISLQNLPKQLTPNVTQPEISINTIWPGASPKEIERDIIQEQELVLKNTPGLIKYESKSSDNSGSLTLTFKIGVDINKAMLDVANKLNEVDTYPENVLKPVIKATGESASPVIWTMLQTLNENPIDIDHYKTYLENEIREYYERIPGVAELFMRSGTQDEMQVLLNSEKMAAYGLSMQTIISIIQRNNVDISAGSMDIGRRSYRIRTSSQYKTPQDIQDLILISKGSQEVRLGEVAKISYGYAKKSSISLVDGIKGLIIGVKPESDTNIIKLTDDVEAMVKKLNDEKLKKMGLKLRWLNDKRDYIQGSIDLVQQNILVGGFLAIIVLLIFLRAISSTTVIALAIPISIIATFIILDALGRSLNTISLAGISFSVGMLVDSAIVVLENIDRHKKMGKKFFDAALDGTNEVWGALIASALTTIAVFLPIIFLQNEAGQLFKDIAITVTAAVSFSLFVSISVIPMLWNQLMKFSKHDTHQAKESSIVSLGHALNKKIMYYVVWTLKSKSHQFTTVALLVVLSAGTSYLLFPKMEYLPQGNRNLIFNIMIPPPGLSYKEKKNIGEEVWRQMGKYTKAEVEGLPQVKRLFFVAGGDFMIFGVLAKDPSRIKELLPILRRTANSFPGVFGISIQAGVFEKGLGKGRTVDIDISGESIEDIAAVGGQLFASIHNRLKGAQVRPEPSIELLFPEVKIIPNREQLHALGLDARQLGIIADVLMDGRKISEFKVDGKKKIDLIIKADQKDIATPEDLYHALVATPNGELVSFDSLSRLERGTSISVIRHLGGKRTITLQVTPPKDLSVQETIEIVQNDILPQVKNPNVTLKITGTADKLIQTIESMKYNLILAIIITYLLMAALFGNFFYPLIIMVTLPLAAAGGFIGLSLTNAFLAPQALDILTMLGFVILIGIVVNNAILIVHQSLNLIRFHNFEHKEAVIEATRSRLRPIFMSTLTSLFGMLPLILAPGPGSEFYRGLGSVITGGLAFSTIFTLFVIPALLLFVIKMENKPRRSRSDVSGEAVLDPSNGKHV